MNAQLWFLAGAAFGLLWQSVGMMIYSRATRKRRVDTITQNIITELGRTTRTRTFSGTDGDPEDW